MSKLVVVTPSYKPTFKQPTHFVIVDAGISYARCGQIVTLKHAAQLIRDCYSVNGDYNPVLIPYTHTKKTHAKLRSKK
jgi:hypothetical protein